MACPLQGLSPVTPPSKLPSEPRQSILEPTANPSQYGEAYGKMPLQPDGVSRVWGANSFAQVPAHGGVFAQDAAKQIGFRMPRL